MNLNLNSWSGFFSILLVTGIVIIAVVAMVAFIHYFAKHILIRLVDKFLGKKHAGLGKTMFKNRVFHRIAYLIPTCLLYGYAYLFDFNIHGAKIYLAELVRFVSITYFIFGTALLISSILDCVHDRYKKLAIAKQRPIKSYLQVIKIALFTMATILSISAIFNKSPLYVLTGLGAATAILLLVFKDSILGFVASIQLAAYDMVRIGDWIEMTTFGADGEVMDISLNTVKVQNFDKTIVTIPSYALLTSGLKNWRGMQEAGGRRIKRSINIDITTIKICDEELLKQLSHLEELRQEDFSRKSQITNMGVFRIYLERYLRGHPGVHKDMKILIRQQQGTAIGLPIELYFFANQIDSEKYEETQADIFDHIYAVLAFFDLRVFQYASSSNDD